RVPLPGTGEAGGRGPSIQLRLPGPVCHHPGTVDGSGLQGHREWVLRAVRPVLIGERHASPYAASTMSHSGTETRRSCLDVSLWCGVFVAHCRKLMYRPESEAQDEHTAHGVQRQLLGTAKGASAGTSAQNQHTDESVAPDL